ncbi:MAG: OmpA family protein [Myxococcota bacterium]|jgi:outer membrane protein OmpA-like peptidoglycan-associated protein|nr:OmpA family protein [Myxococcota bacterium]
MLNRLMDTKTWKKNLTRALGAGAMATCAMMLAACATAPDELQQARSTYDSVAQDSVTKQYAAAELRKAELALQKAEAEFDKRGDEESTRTYAYIAQRKAVEASVIAETRKAEQTQAQKKEQLIDESERKRQVYKSAYQREKVAKIMTEQELESAREKYASAEGELSAARTKLEEAKQKGELSEEQLNQMEKELVAKEQRLAATADKLEEAEKARKELKAELSDARKELVEIAKVKEEQSRMVITLNGSVLFKTGESNLMPTAQRKLDQVAAVLKEHEDKYITIEGHTDSRGDTDDNMSLSRSRATSVMNYLVSQGVPQNRVKAVGVGESQPIASNDTPEGRANNRRVEIILSENEMKGQASL